MTTGSELSKYVGPIITTGEIADAAVEAAELDNPGREIRVTEGPSYIRLESPEELVLTVENMSLVLGREFNMGELERNMPGFAGLIRMSSEGVKFLAKKTRK